MGHPPTKTPRRPRAWGREHAVRSAYGGALLLAAACERSDLAARTRAIQAQPPPSAPTVLGRLGADELVVGRVTFRGPEGGDAREPFELGLRGADGVVRPLEVGGPVLEAAVWEGTVVVLDPRGRLLRTRSDGFREPLGEDVVGALAVSRDGRALAYARVPGDEGELHVRRGAQDTTVARGFASLGVVRLSDDGERVCFVGTRNGGVTGVHVASTRDDREVRCVSNCTLRAGEPWRDPFVDLPDGPTALACATDRVSWTSRDGQRTSVTLEPAR